jgi:hypothetical protein
MVANDTYPVTNVAPAGTYQGVPYPGYPVIAMTYCRRIRVQENYDIASPPTADLLRFSNVPGANPTRVPQGVAAVWDNGDAHFYSGQIVGFILTVTGSITVQQIEGNMI